MTVKWLLQNMFLKKLSDKMFLIQVLWIVWSELITSLRHHRFLPSSPFSLVVHFWLPLMMKTMPMPMPMSWSQHCTRSGHNCLEMGTLQYESIQLNDIHAIIVYNLIKNNFKMYYKVLRSFLPLEICEWCQTGTFPNGCVDAAWRIWSNVFEFVVLE